MRMMAAIAGEVIGLFLADTFMALAILGLAAVSALLTLVVHVSPILVGALLALGCVVILAISTLRVARSP